MADGLANWRLLQHPGYYSLQDPPMAIRGFLLADLVGVGRPHFVLNMNVEL